jgi:YesN/AraC family two-component response regulator
MAFNGEEAIEAVGQLKPDVVILDIRMPCKSGISNE